MAALKVTLRQLQVFKAIADSGSTSAAALALPLSQSATSSALKELETQLSLRLFERVGKRLILNDDGRALLPLALAVLDGAAGIESWAEASSTRVGLVSIGASTTIGTYLLPRILAQLNEPAPSAGALTYNAAVCIANSSVIARKVRDFELDVGLIEGPCHESGVLVTPWIEDELVVVAAPSDPLAAMSRKGVVTREALAAAIWLLREPGSGTRETVDQALVPYVHSIKAGMEFGNSEAIKRAVAVGLGITCLSRLVVAGYLERGELVEIRTPFPKLLRQLFIIRNEKKILTAGVERLLHALSQEPQPLP